MDEPFGCDYCAWDDNRLYGHVPEVASREGRQLTLHRCPRCGTLYEQNESGSIDDRISPDEADRFYPGWDRPDSN